MATATITQAPPLTVEQAEEIVADPRCFLDEGSGRVVYLSHDLRWVIKVEDDEFEDFQNSFEDEVYTAWKNRILPAFVRIPETYLLENGWIVQQYVNGEHPRECMYSRCFGCDYEHPEWGGKCYREITEPITVDNHYRNIKIVDETIWIIDLG